MTTPMESIANDVHDDVKDAAFYYLSEQDARKSQRRAREHQEALNTQMAMLARENRQNAAFDEVQGLIKAGMSPVLAGGGSFSPAASSGSGPMAQPAMPNLSHSQMAHLAQEQRELEWQQKQWNDVNMDLAKSQAEKNRADAAAATSAAGLSQSQTEMNNYVHDLWISRDESIAASAKKFAEAVSNNPDASEMDKAIAGAFAECSNPDSGSLEGINSFLDHVKKYHTTEADLATENLRAAIANDQIKDADTREALARLPEAQFNQLTAAAGELVSQMYLNETKKDLTRSDIEKTRQLIVNYAKEADKLDAEVAKLKAERKAIVHGDIIQSMEEDPAATFLRETYQLGKQAGQAYVGGKAAGGVLRNAGKYVPKQNPQPIDIKFDESWRYNKNGQPTSHKRSEMRRLAE